MVDCGRDECHKTGWWCVQGHPGLIQGGMAPTLIDLDRELNIDASLIPEADKPDEPLTTMQMVARLRGTEMPPDEDPDAVRVQRAKKSAWPRTSRLAGAIIRTR
jgi:hypothetical protein